MSSTTIKTNWDKMLKEGEQTQAEVMELLRSRFPDIRVYGDGKQKEADLEVPSLSLLFEIKRDEKSDQTGNFAFEYMFRGKPSGIWATKADYYVMVDHENFYFFKRQELFDWLVLNKKYGTKVEGGDDDDAKMILFPKVILANRGYCTIMGRNGKWRENLNLL